MKNYKLIVNLVLIFFSSIAIGQTMACCTKISSTEAFAMLAGNNGFASSHESPLPFNYVSQNGHMITFKTADGKEGRAFELKASKPTNKFILVVHEWWGLNDYIKQESEKLYNDLGDVNVIAIDLYDGKVASVKDSAGKYMQALTTERANTLINGIITYMGKDAQIGTIGWCFGGGWSLQSSLLAGTKAKACVMYYGMPEKDLSKLKKLNATVLGIFAAKDKWITPEVVSAFEKDMKSIKKDLTIKTYDADHAFANPSNPHFNKEFSEEAHKIVLGFFKTHL